MRRQATFFDARVPRLVATAISFAVLSAAPVGARVLVGVDEALELAFPDCVVKRESVFLTDEEVATAAALAGGARPSALAARYVATRAGEVVGTAYFDTHRVRTLEETVMVVVLPDGAVGRIEVISFHEPMDYLPRSAWYRQFDGKVLDDDLDLDRGIRVVTGATLTATATTAAARRVLALHDTLRVRGGER